MTTTHIDIQAPTPGMTLEDKYRWERGAHLRWRAMAMSWEDALRKARQEVAFLRKANYDLIMENKRLMGQGAAPVGKKTQGGVYLP